VTIINRIFEQLPFSIGSAAKRRAIARDITRALPDVEASQARIAQLEAALATAREDALREAASLCAGAGAFADEMEKPILDLIGNEAKP
jgi:uncharacterized protein YbjQ (UPF0145 family)